MSYDDTMYELMTELPDPDYYDPDYHFWRKLYTDVCTFLNSL